MVQKVHKQRVLTRSSVKIQDASLHPFPVTPFLPTILVCVVFAPPYP